MKAALNESAARVCQLCGLMGMLGLFGFGVSGETTPGGAELEGGEVPGDVAGGAVPGDDVGGTVPGANVEGGVVPGAEGGGGEVPGDDVEGGAVPGADGGGGTVPGDSVEGGAVPGDDEEGGAVPGDIPDAPPGGAACAPAAAARPSVVTRIIDRSLAISLTFQSVSIPLIAIGIPRIARVCGLMPGCERWSGLCGACRDCRTSPT